MKISHCGDIHVEEDRYFRDTAQCLQWFVEDSIHANTNLFVVDGDLTTYKQTMTDLCCHSYPEAPEYPVLWVTDSRRTAPFGETLRISLE